MKYTLLFPIFGFVLVVVAAAGCTGVGVNAIRQQSSNEQSPLVLESQANESATAPQSHSHGASQTLARRSAARQPLRSSLITLAAGDDLMSKINAANGPVLLDFYADWCGPCRVQGKILHEMETTAAQHQMLMIKVDVDQHPQIAEQLEVQSIPTLIMVKDGQIANRQSGIADQDRLLSWIAASSQE